MTDNGTVEAEARAVDLSMIDTRLDALRQQQQQLEQTFAALQQQMTQVKTKYDAATGAIAMLESMRRELQGEQVG